MKQSQIRVKEKSVPDFERDYEAWREDRLRAWPRKAEQDIISIEDPTALGETERNQLQQQCTRTNFALYRLNRPASGTKEAIRRMIYELGMRDLDQNLCADNDCVTTLKVMNISRAQGYIPYTSKALNWHTDGYYNEPNQPIRSFALHCVQSASSGGENMLLNHELMYIRLFDEDPRLVAALMQPDVLTIPPNIEEGVKVRSAQTGPVFYRDPQTDTLHMRYTARTRSIHWKDEPQVSRAVQAIENLLKNPHELVLRYTLQAGEGIVCNNILHGRSAFTNGNMSDGERVLYRIRSTNRLFSED